MGHLRVLGVTGDKSFDDPDALPFTAFIAFIGDTEAFFGEAFFGEAFTFMDFITFMGFLDFVAGFLANDTWVSSFLVIGPVLIHFPFTKE